MKDKGCVYVSMLLYGYGDGGGGFLWVIIVYVLRFVYCLNIKVILFLSNMFKLLLISLYFFVYLLGLKFIIFFNIVWEYDF